MIHVDTLEQVRELDPTPVRIIGVTSGGYDCYLNDEAVPRTLEGATAEKLAAINTYAADLRRTVRQASQPYATDEEMSTWSMKRAEALAYRAFLNPADAPTLAVEAQVRGVTLDEIVDRVSANAAYLTNMEAVISGNAGRHRDAVNALAADPAATVEQIDGYDFTIGWPA